MKLGRFAGPLGLALTAAQVASVVHRHWQGLPSDERRRVGEIVRGSHGDPRRLSTADVREIARRLDLSRLARRTARTVAVSRWRAPR